MNTKTTFKFLVVLCWAVTGSAGWCVRSRFASSAHEHSAMYKVADLKLGIWVFVYSVGAWSTIKIGRAKKCKSGTKKDHIAATPLPVWMSRDGMKVSTVSVLLFIFGHIGQQQRRMCWVESKGRFVLYFPYLFSSVQFHGSSTFTDRHYWIFTILYWQIQTCLNCIIGAVSREKHDNLPG